MIIQLEDGRKMEVPDGATPDEIDATIAEVVAKPTAPSATVEKAGTTLPAPSTESTVAPEVSPTVGGRVGADLNLTPEVKVAGKLPYGMNQAAIDQTNKRINAKNEYEKSFIGDEERQRLREQEQGRPFLSAAGEGLSHIVDEFSAGTALAPKWMPQALRDILNYRIGGDNTLTEEERQKQVDEYMKQHNERYDITRGEHPVGTTMGEILPFMATGLAGERGMVALGKSLATPLRKANVKVAEMLGDNIGAGYLRNAAARTPSQYVQNINTITRGAATGAAEGAAQYDTTAGEGAATAALGGVLGAVGPMRILTKVRNERDEAGKKIIDEMRQNGFQITPGVRTNNRALQTQEAGLRNSEIFGDEFYNSVDRPNQRRITDMAGEAIGLNTKNRDILSQEELSNHMADLRNKYTALEQNTFGKMGLNKVNQAGNILKDLQPTAHRNTSPDDLRRYQTVKSIFDQFKAEIASPRRSTSGQFQGYIFDGKQYQAIRQRVSDEASQAYQSGDKRLGDSLVNMRKVLDDSLTSGMNNADANMWKDLNERYAMTKLLMDGGMTPSGKVDPTKLTSAVMSSDEAARTLQGKGGRIKKFQDIARYNDVLNDVQGSSLTGLGMEAKPHRSGMFTRAADLALKPHRLLGLGYSLNTLTTPFIGRHLSPAHGLEQGTGILLNRALAQTETPQDYVGDKYDQLLEAIKGNK